MRLKLTAKSKMLCKKLILRQKEDLDAVIGINGFEGSGKSSLSLQLAKYIARKNGTKFLLDKNIIYGDDFQKVIHSLKSLPQFSVIILDEAISLLYKRNSNTKNQKKLNVLFSIIRQKNYIVFLNIPNITDIDSFYISHRILLILEIFKRGFYYCLAKSSNKYSDDPFYLKIASRLYADNEYMDKAQLIQLVMHQLPNFLFWSKFFKVDDDYYNKYKFYKQKYTMSEELENEKENKLESKKDIMLRNAIIALYKSNTKYTYGKIATLLGTTKYKVKKILSGV